MDSDDEYDAETEAYLKLPAANRPEVKREDALRALQALPTQVRSARERSSEAEIIQLLHDWACVIHDMIKARDNAVNEFYDALQEEFPYVYDWESTKNVITRMKVIFEEGMRENDVAQWKSCFTCPKQVPSDYMKGKRWDPATQEYVLKETQDPQDFVCVNGSDGDAHSIRSLGVRSVAGSDGSQDANSKDDGSLQEDITNKGDQWSVAFPSHTVTKDSSASLTPGPTGGPARCA